MFRLKTAPTSLPVTRAELKTALRVPTPNFAQDLTASQSIRAGVQAVVPSYGLLGFHVNVLGQRVVAILDVGAIPAGASVDVKLQESDDLVEWFDVDSGAFPQVTEANGDQVHQLAYHGAATYIRAVATVAGDACPFGVTIGNDAAAAPDDVLLDALNRTATTMVENYLGMALMPQTWEMVLDGVPKAHRGRRGAIDLPRPPLVSARVFYVPCGSSSEAEMPAEDLVVDTIGDRVTLADNACWPIVRNVAGVRVEWVAGHASAAAVPADIRQGIIETVRYLYEKREASDLPAAVRTILGPHRVLRV